MTWQLMQVCEWQNITKLWMYFWKSSVYFQSSDSIYIPVRNIGTYIKLILDREVTALWNDGGMLYISKVQIPVWIIRTYIKLCVLYFWKRSYCMYIEMINQWSQYWRWSLIWFAFIFQRLMNQSQSESKCVFAGP